MITLYGIKTCDTCRKAAKALGVSLHDVRADPLTPAQLDHFYATLGEALINKKSTTWRGLDDGARGRDPLDLLADHPTLMKRPVIDMDGTLYLGWGKDVQAALEG